MSFQDPTKMPARFQLHNFLCAQNLKNLGIIRILLSHSP